MHPFRVLQNILCPGRGTPPAAVPLRIRQTARGPAAAAEEMYKRACIYAHSEA
jgi:hypothetical protein